MAFSVELSFRARSDLDEIAAYIAADSPTRSAKWRARLHQKLQSLKTMPRACGIAPEDEIARYEIRQLLFGKYRVLFSIRDTTVYVLTVRHGARRFLTTDELDDTE
jgi:plasmid stabilization system protein ParE